MHKTARNLMSNIKKAAMKIILLKSKHTNKDWKNNCGLNIFSCHKGISLPKLQEVSKTFIWNQVAGSLGGSLWQGK